MQLREHRHGHLRKIRPVLAGAAILALTACGSTAAPAAIAPDATTTAVDSASLPTEPVSSGAVREVFRIDDMRSLVKQSDLVIIGRATSVALGRRAGRDAGGQLSFRDVAVEVQRVLHGTYDQPTLTLEELGWKDGEPFRINGAAWAAAGDTMLMGLKVTANGAAASGPRYILTSSSARFFLEPGGDVRVNYRAEHVQQEANAFVREAAALNVDELIRRIEDAG